MRAPRRKAALKKMFGRRHALSGELSINEDLVRPADSLMVSDG